MTGYRNYRGAGIRVEGTDSFRRAAAALNELGDKKITAAVRKSFRKVAKPLGEEMVDTLAEDMPRRGGLSDKVHTAKVGVRTTLRGKNVGMQIQLRGRRGPKTQDLASLNRGVVRHPSIGTVRLRRDKWKWVDQSVPGGGATKAFNEGAADVRRELVDEISHAIDEAARKV